jgi:adenylate cyclase, class 2
MTRSKPEVEIKFPINDLKSLETALRRNGFRRVGKRAHEMNVLYDFPDRRLRKRGELLRLREYAGTWTLTHKAKAIYGRHKRRHEAEVDISDGHIFADIVQSLGMRESFRYEKFRTKWSDGTGEVVLDETPIGNVGEIEGPARWIDRTARTLGVKRTDYSTQSYAELFFEWKRQTGSTAQDMTFAAVRTKGAKNARRG